MATDKTEPTGEAPEVAPEPVPAAPAPVAPVTVSVPTAPASDLPDESVNYVAARGFRARFEHQVHSFVEGEIIDSRVGHALRKTGSPIRLVEKIAGEIKAAL